MELEITPTDHPPRELLLSADESPASVDDYARRGTCYVARSDGRLVGEYVLLHTRPFTAEIVNLAVASAYRRRGIGTALLAHAVATARKAGFRILEIGTGDTSSGPLALYERCGFVRCGVERDYFRKYYPKPVVEHGVECRDMIRLRMELD